MKEAADLLQAESFSIYRAQDNMQLKQLDIHIEDAQLMTTIKVCLCICEHWATVLSSGMFTVPLEFIFVYFEVSTKQVLLKTQVRGE